jgi:GxxExxY protein
MVKYKGFTQEARLQYGMLVEGCVLVKAKAVERVLPADKTRLLNTMKLLNDPLGLIINFQEIEVTKGISCLLLPGANL